MTGLYSVGLQFYQ